FLVGQLQAAEELLCGLYRQRRHLVDRAAGDADVARLAPQPRAAAIGTRQVAAITAEKNPHVHLVFLPLEPPEETADAVVLLVPFDHEPLLVVAQLRPRDVEPQPPLLRCP